MYQLYNVLLTTTLLTWSNRRVLEERFVARIQRAHPTLSHKEAMATLHTWISTLRPDLVVDGNKDDDDLRVATYLMDTKEKANLKLKV